MRIYKRGLINQKLIDAFHNTKSLSQMQEAVNYWRYQRSLHIIRMRQLYIFFIVALIVSFFLIFASCSTPSAIANRKFYKSLNIHPQTVYANCGTIAPPVVSKHTYVKTGVTKLSPNSVVINCDTVRDGVFYPVPVTVPCPPSELRVDTFYNETVIVNNAKEIAQGFRIEEYIKQVAQLDTERRMWRTTAIISIILLIIVFTLKFIL